MRMRNKKGDISVIITVLLILVLLVSTIVLLASIDTKKKRNITEGYEEVLKFNRENENAEFLNSVFGKDISGKKVLSGTKGFLTGEREIRVIVRHVS